MSDAVRDATLTEATLRESLRSALTARARSVVPASQGAGAESATLACLFERDGDTHVWLLKRPETMRRHSGQVAFPGGKRDPSDATLLRSMAFSCQVKVRVDLIGVGCGQPGQEESSFTKQNITRQKKIRRI